MLLILVAGPFLIVDAQQRVPVQMGPTLVVPGVSLAGINLGDSITLVLARFGTPGAVCVVGGDRLNVLWRYGIIVYEREGIVTGRSKPGQQVAPGEISFAVWVRPSPWNNHGLVKFTPPSVEAESVLFLTREVEIRVPGKILETNGFEVGENVAQWTWFLPGQQTAWVSYMAPNWPGRLLILGIPAAAIVSLGVITVRHRGHAPACPGCGTRLAPNARFCTSCGTQLGQAGKE